VVAEGERCANQCVVAEGLGEVAELAAGEGVVFFGEQADVVSQVEQPLEQLAGLVVRSLHGEHLGEPERAGEKDAFVAR